MATETTTNDETKTDDTKTDETDTGSSGKGSKDTTDGDDDLDAEKWKALARKHEKKSGTLQAELENIKAANMS